MSITAWWTVVSTHYAIRTFSSVFRWKYICLWVTTCFGIVFGAFQRRYKGKILMDVRPFSQGWEHIICNLRTPAQHSIDERPGQHGVRDEPKLVDLICVLLKLPMCRVNRINFNDYIICSSSTTQTAGNHWIHPDFTFQTCSILLERNGRWCLVRASRKLSWFSHLSFLV